MKYPWLAYTVVGLLSLGVGVAIAGLPNDAPTDAIVVSSVEPPTTTSTTTTTAAPSTTEPEPVVETTDVVTSDVGSIPPADSIADPPLGGRDQVVVVAANGAQVDRAATRMATGLERLGYLGVRSLTGTQTVDYTTVYYADGFEAAAARMAADLALHPDFIAPLASAPDVPDLPADADLLVYVGVDRAT